MGIRLFIGGRAQGKLNYVLQKYHLGDEIVWDGGKMQQALPPGSIIIVNHFHDWVRQKMMEGNCPEERVSLLTERYEECIFICDEVGNGIVPGDAQEGEYRERLGRMLVELAGKAETVERILCGIGQRIK